MGLLKVSGHSRSTSVAGAIAGIIREGSVVEVQAIGASAVNQAVKAIAIARGYLANDGIAVVCIPIFVAIEIEGQQRTALKLIVQRPEHPLPPVTPLPRAPESAATPKPAWEGAPAISLDSRVPG